MLLLSVRCYSFIARRADHIAFQRGTHPFRLPRYLADHWTYIFVPSPPPARVAPDAACRSKRMHVMDSECAILEARLAKLQERNGALKGEVAGVREEANGLVCRMQETLALDPMDAMVA